MPSTFVIVNTAHPVCDECAGCAVSAEGTARATGSVGATYEVVKADDTRHFATVTRED